jgi:hypothetical protein
MALLRKKTTSRMVAANRANSLKSSGPRTTEGKIQSSRNAIKSGIHSNPLLARSRALGEDPAEFEELHRALLDVFAPGDAFEQMLVEDMTVLRWRKLRLCRAETNAWDRHNRPSLPEPVDADDLAEDPDSAEVAAETEDLVSMGREIPSWMEQEPETYGNLSCPSEDDRGFPFVVFALSQFAADFEDFDEAGMETLKTLYGPEPGVAGSTLLARYEQFRREEKGADGAKRARNREVFRKALDDEINFYVRVNRLMHGGRKEQGIFPYDDMDKVMRYEAHLERQFERKVQQLVAWRRFKGENVASVPASLNRDSSRAS